MIGDLSWPSFAPARHTGGTRDGRTHEDRGAARDRRPDHGSRELRQRRGDAGAYRRAWHRRGLRGGADGPKDIAKNAVRAKHIKKNQVKTKHVAQGAVRTAKLRDGAVTEAKLAAGVAPADLAARIADLEATVAAQQELLAGISRVTVDGHDTLRLTGMNLQLVNGTGATDEDPNGLGNLIIGYSAQRSDPFPPATRIGSHYLVVGDRHEWTAVGGIVAGFFNTASADWASVSGGAGNTASGDRTSVSGGLGNTASSGWASVSGGQGNTASGVAASVSGGIDNTASGGLASILGGNTQTVGAQFGCHPTC